jgi:hypothetical protein
MARRARAEEADVILTGRNLIAAGFVERPYRPHS